MRMDYGLRLAIQYDIANINKRIVVSLRAVAHASSVVPLHQKLII